MTEVGRLETVLFVDTKLNEELAKRLNVKVVGRNNSMTKWLGQTRLEKRLSKNILQCL